MRAEINSSVDLGSTSTISWTNLRISSELLKGVFKNLTRRDVPHGKNNS